MLLQVAALPRGLRDLKLERLPDLHGIPVPGLRDAAFEALLKRSGLSVGDFDVPPG